MFNPTQPWAVVFKESDDEQKADAERSRPHRRRTQAIAGDGPGALNRLEELPNQTKHKTVAKKTKRLLDKHKGKK